MCAETRYCTLSELGTRLGASLTTLRRLVKQDDIPRIILGRSWGFSEASAGLLLKALRIDEMRSSEAAQRDREMNRESIDQALEANPNITPEELGRIRAGKVEVLALQDWLNVLTFERDRHYFLNRSLATRLAKANIISICEKELL